MTSYTVPCLLDVGLGIVSVGVDSRTNETSVRDILSSQDLEKIYPTIIQRAQERRSGQEIRPIDTGRTESPAQKRERKK